MHLQNVCVTACKACPERTHPSLQAAQSCKTDTHINEVISLILGAIMDKGAIVKKIPHDTADMQTGHATHLSFKEVSLSGISNVIPKGYRHATLSEVSKEYAYNKAFKEDMDRAGSAWVLGTRTGRFAPVCARAYYGLFRVDNPAYNEEDKALTAHYRPVTNTAHVAYVRDERVQISRQRETMTTFKNALRREAHAILY